MTKENISSFEIVKHNSFSWSYVYIINGKKRDIHGDSLHDLRKKVLSKGLPWDHEHFPDEKITKNEYDSIEVPKLPVNSNNQKYGEETFECIESQKIGDWTPSSKKLNRKRDIYRKYDPDYY